MSFAGFQIGLQLINRTNQKAPPATKINWHHQILL